MDSAVTKLKREVMYIQWLKDMENFAVHLFSKVTVIDSVINIQVYALEKFPNTG